MTTLKHIKFLLIALVPIAVAEPNLDSLITARQSIADELQAVDQDGRQKVKHLQERQAALRSQLADAKTALADREGNKTEAAERLKKQQAEGTAAAEKLKAWQAAAKTHAQAIRTEIATGIPYERDKRLARIDRILEALDDADPLTQGKAVADLFAFLGDELVLSRESRLQAAPVMLGERKIQAYRIRSGLANELFVSEDGSVSGIAINGEWQTELTESQRAGIRDAAASMRSLQPADVRAVPIGGSK